MSPPGEKFAENVRRSPENLAAAKRRIEASAMSNYALEAAGHTEDIIAWLQQEWASRGFTFEQSVFALALATINFREGAPEQFGGKETFDRVAAEAKKYYDANK